MLHKYVTTVGLALVLLGLASTVVVAQNSSNVPVSHGVVAAVTALDARTSMATLQTNAGEVFEHPQGWQWHVGHKVLCDLIESGRLSKLQRCKLWESAQDHARGVQAPPAPLQAPPAPRR
jgi:hypothetical protein